MFVINISQVFWFTKKKYIFHEMHLVNWQFILLAHGFLYHHHSQ